MKMEFASKGLAAFGDTRAISDQMRRAAAQALNSTVQKTRAMVVDRLGREIAFPAGYLDPAGGRLGVQGTASPEVLEVRLRARGRATSLARFASGAVVGKRGGVNVEVKPGKTVRMPRAFVIRLNNGNLGLAMRLRPGESMQRSRAAQQMRNGLWLLYGPSVAQGFAQHLDKGKLIEETGATMEAEFSRYMRVAV